MTVWIATVHDHERDTGFNTGVYYIAQSGAVGVESNPHILNIIDDPI